MPPAKSTDIPPIEAEAAVTPPEPNGAKPGPQMMRREKWANLPGDYEAFRFRFWVNHPVGVMSRVKLTLGMEQKEALCEIVLEHNGWRDFEGNPYPPASDPEFWDLIPDEVAAAIIATVEAEKGELPNLASRTRRR